MDILAKRLTSAQASNIINKEAYDESQKELEEIKATEAAAL